MSHGADQRPKYFARHAEPEAQLASAVQGVRAAALVVPVCRESLAFLDGYQVALSRSAGRVLCVVVVNGAVDASAETHAQNERLLAELALRFPDRAPLGVQGVSAEAWLARAEHCDLLWLDRASQGARLPVGEGVGLARKIGGDLCALLWVEGKLACSQIACTDADATLPSDYFERLASSAADAPPGSALLWPFTHEPGGESAIDEATTLYEISLRYYVLGLAAAGSPYAYQSIGSSLCFDAAAYASVRGFPKRAAAEDFYLLDKLSKVGPLRRVPGAPIRLRARASDRVPFGTGRRTGEIAELTLRGAGFELYAPELFRALGVVVNGLDAFAASGEPSAFRMVVEREGGEHGAAIGTVLARLKVFEALTAAAGQAPAGVVLRRRVHTWFDGLRTLRFVHLLREACLPQLPWREALAAAPFLPEPCRDTRDAEPGALRARLERVEAALPVLVGPTL